MTSVSISSSIRTSPLSLIIRSECGSRGSMGRRPQTDGNRWIGGDRRRRGRNAYIVALDLRRDLRKLRGRQFIAVREHDGPKQGVLELPHVSGETISREQRERVVGQSANALALFYAKAGEEPHREILARRTAGARSGGIETGNTLRR